MFPMLRNVQRRAHSIWIEEDAPFFCQIHTACIRFYKLPREDVKLIDSRF
jgi:hypothetical protein